MTCQQKNTMALLLTSFYMYRNTWSESEYESSDDEKNGAEKILEAMDLPYKDQPHAKGDSSYIFNEDDEEEEEEEEPKQTEAAEILPAELEKRDNNIFEDFSELIKIESRAGKLNKDVVYLNIASMKSGDIFVSTNSQTHRNFLGVIIIPKME